MGMFFLKKAHKCGKQIADQTLRHFRNRIFFHVPVTIGDSLDKASLLVRISRMTCFSAFSGEELRRLPMESVDSVAEEPVSSTLKLAVSAISAKQKTKG